MLGIWDDKQRRQIFRMSYRISMDLFSKLAPLVRSQDTRLWHLVSIDRWVQMVV